MFVTKFCRQAYNWGFRMQNYGLIHAYTEVLAPQIEKCLFVDNQ